jgi:hypothetical protein
MGSVLVEEIRKKHGYITMCIGQHNVRCMLLKEHYQHSSNNIHDSRKGIKTVRYRALALRNP